MRRLLEIPDARCIGLQQLQKALVIFVGRRQVGLLEQPVTIIRQPATRFQRQGLEVGLPEEHALVRIDRRIAVNRKSARLNSSHYCAARMRSAPCNTRNPPDSTALLTQLTEDVTRK